jgi:hypothetical protein
MVDKRKIAQGFGINAELFVAFMDTRFPGEDDVYYLKEWAGRFQEGEDIVEGYMDNQSKAVYRRLKAMKVGE